MFAGHVGAALLLGRAEKAVNIGILSFAALLPDFLLWSMILLGWESAVIPANFASSHQPVFVFPYSHGLLATIGWSACAGLAAFTWLPVPARRRTRAALLVAAAVFSHWLLDALVHAPELPLLGMSSTKIGLGLWQKMPLALSVEAALAIAGLFFFLQRPGMSQAKRLGLCVFVLLVLALTVAGMTVAPPPPDAISMAASSLVAIGAVCLMIGWLGRGATDASA